MVEYKQHPIPEAGQEKLSEDLREIAVKMAQDEQYNNMEIVALLMAASYIKHE